MIADANVSPDVQAQMEMTVLARWTLRPQTHGGRGRRQRGDLG